ncbi:hypothetical protein [Gordonia malaquae]|uniref:hypothetical protein n=1 Tax=Gordonia malaquae TaxID=410332 RepID=UPI003017D61B
MGTRVDYELEHVADDDGAYSHSEMVTYLDGVETARAEVTEASTIDLPGALYQEWAKKQPTPDSAG